MHLKLFLISTLASSSASIISGSETFVTILHSNDIVGDSNKNIRGGLRGAIDGSTSQGKHRALQTTLTYVGNDGSPSSAFPLDECQGDCDDNDECAGDLVCFKRDALEPVPGCSGDGDSGRDYCVDRSKFQTVLWIRGDDLPKDSYGLCEGDCDSDSDCQGNLKCLQRSSSNPIPVPGCTGEDDSSNDYCYGDLSPTSSPTNSPSSKPVTPEPTATPTKQPTFSPTTSPTMKPTTSPALPMPTTSPTKKPTGAPTTTTISISLTRVGNNGSPFPEYPLAEFPLSECQGDCDDDSECGPGLKCFMRNDIEPVPGCSGDGRSKTDYCAKRETPTTLFLTGDNGDIIGLCEGDCDNNDECAGTLECFKRSGTEEVPGCEGLGASSKDYCYDPNFAFNPTISPSMDTPTKVPTGSPVTSSPTAHPVPIGEDAPTSGPTKKQTNSPTKNPTDSPITEPTASPTKKPSDSPTMKPSSSPTDAPTSNPSDTPSKKPNGSPVTSSPTAHPVGEDAPTSGPTKVPTDAPVTFSPTNSPTKEPSNSPTREPTNSPSTKEPTNSPSKEPTASPTTKPSESPTKKPTQSPTKKPTTSPQVSASYCQNPSLTQPGADGLCEGQCTNDLDCQANLECFRRVGTEAVPSCSGEGTSGVGYCTYRPNNYLWIKAENGLPTEVYPLGVCEGNCELDTDCEGYLICQVRSGDEEVPGCDGNGGSGINYCRYPDLAYLGGTPEYPLAACTGDCDENSHCESGLLCYQRKDDEVVPGCSGDARSKSDYCAKRETPTTLFLTGDDGDTMGLCEGDCDNNDECAGTLECFPRSGTEEVPGCEGLGASGKDYCYDPNFTSSPTASPDDYYFYTTDGTSRCDLGNKPYNIQGPAPLADNTVLRFLALGDTPYDASANTCIASDGSVQDPCTDFDCDGNNNGPLEEVNTCTYEGDEFECIRDQIIPYMNEKIEANEAAFIFHAGDILAGTELASANTRCNRHSFKSRRDLYQAATNFLIVPGDNDWEECIFYDVNKNDGDLRDDWREFFAEDTSPFEQFQRNFPGENCYPEIERKTSPNAQGDVNPEMFFFRYNEIAVFGLNRNDPRKTSYVNDISPVDINAEWVASRLGNDCSFKSIIILAQSFPDQPVYDAIDIDYFGKCGAIPSLIITGDTHPKTYCMSKGENERVFLTVEAKRSGPLTVSIVRDPNGGDYVHVEDSQLTNQNSQCPSFV